MWHYVIFWWDCVLAWLLVCPKYSVFNVLECWLYWLNCDIFYEFTFLVWVVVSYIVLLIVMPEIKQVI